MTQFEKVGIHGIVVGQLSADGVLQLLVGVRAAVAGIGGSHLHQEDKQDDHHGVLRLLLGVKLAVSLFQFRVDVADLDVSVGVEGEQFLADAFGFVPYRYIAEGDLSTSLQLIEHEGTRTEQRILAVVSAPRLLVV